MRQVLKLEMHPVNWSLVDAYKEEEDRGCQLPKNPLEGIEDLSLEDRLKRIDQANQVFMFNYAEHNGKYFKIPLVRNHYIEDMDIAVKITKEEYNQALKILEKAGEVQRIVRAVPYSEINETIMEHIGRKDIDLDDVVLVGVDRGGRLPTHIVRDALGKDRAYFLKVDQGRREIDIKRFQQYVDSELFKNKYVIFVDSTVDSGRQISALRKYFDDEDIAQDIGHRGWVVVGSNECGQTLENHLNIDWGLDPDVTFEDNPQLMGVDYGRSYTQVKACGNKMSTALKTALREVPKGIVLDTGAVKTKRRSAEKTVNKTVKKEKQRQYKTLLIIGDAQDVTLGEDDAKMLALKIENGFQVMAGTPKGNPGYVLELVAGYDQGSVTLVQPVYRKGKAYTNGFHTVYEGMDKEQFRDCMIGKADIVLALGGNRGTWTEIQKSIAQRKPTIVVRDFGWAGEHAADQLEGNSSLYLAESLEDAVSTVAKHR
jgi:hypoxanthine phosphoribosyltransferase